MKRTISILLILVLFVSLLLQVPTIAKEYPQTRYEAEEAVLSGVQTNTDHAGYTGTGFVDHFDAKGDFVEFSVDLAEAGDYSFLIRYANAGGYYASAKVFFDGVFEATAVFPSLASWDEWSTSEVGKYLTAGTHTVRIAYNNHAINIDSLTVSATNDPAVSRITVTITSDDKALKQLILQTERLEVTRQVFVLDGEKSLERELLLLKVASDVHNRSELREIASIYKAKIIDLSPDSMVFELIGKPDKIDAFLKMFTDYKILEQCRTGVTALERGGMHQHMQKPPQEVREAQLPLPGTHCPERK